MGSRAKEENLMVKNRLVQYDKSAQNRLLNSYVLAKKRVSGSEYPIKGTRICVVRVSKKDTD